jgi:hypothetical protein
MRLEFSESDIKRLVETVAATLIPKLIEEIKSPDRLVWPHNELAKALGVSTRTLADYRDDGKIVGSQPGRGWVYSREDVLRFLAKTRVN